MEPGQMSRGPARANREGKQNMVGASAPAGRKPEPSVPKVSKEKHVCLSPLS